MTAPIARVYNLAVYGSKTEGIYKVGEKIIFYAYVLANSSTVLGGTVTWTLLKNGVIPVAQGEFPLDAVGAGVETVADEPCCLECCMTYHPADGAAALSASLGAAVDPFEIRTGMPEPADFDTFWERQKMRLAAIPLQASLTRLPTRGFDCFDVQVDCVDQVPVSGLLALPAGGQKDRKYPAVICLHGAGARSARTEHTFPFIENGFMAFDINAHGLPNLCSPEFYASINIPPADYHFTIGQTESVCFIAMFLRVKRAVEFIASRPEWDGRHIILLGGSMGGFQCFAGAYLDARVSAIANWAPAGCDLGGFTAGRRLSWPLAGNMLDQSIRANVLRSCGYFDSANFASRIKVPGRFAVGLVDKACSPYAIYAAYNNYAGRKSIVTAPWMGHTIEPAILRELVRFVIEQATAQIAADLSS